MRYSPCQSGTPSVELRPSKTTPDALTDLGFARREESTTDPNRCVRYEREPDDDRSQLRLIIQIEFKLVLTDEPLPAPTRSYSYLFTGMFLPDVRPDDVGPRQGY